MSPTTSISMPSMTAWKSSRLSRKSRTGTTRPACAARDFGIERVDVGAPAVELLEALAARTARVGDVVDLAAKGIDFEHGLALRARQNAHRVVKRAARRPLGRSRVWSFCQRQRSSILRFVAGREHAADAAGLLPIIGPRRPKPATPALPRWTRWLKGSRPPSRATRRSA